MASIGHPLCGDTLYGSPEGSPLIGRQALHAFSLTFPHPADGRLLTLTAPLLPDMQSLITQAGLTTLSHQEPLYESLTLTRKQDSLLS